MKNINTVHGNFTSFKEMGAALGVKVKTPKAKVHKCSFCGEPLRQVQGTNVWVCDNPMVIRDAKLKINGKETDVQVFGPCGVREIS